jgi:hypothetical protein
MSNHYHLALRMGEVARALEKYVESASRLVSRAATKRVEDEEFEAMTRAVDATVNVPGTVVDVMIFTHTVHGGIEWDVAQGSSLKVGSTTSTTACRTASTFSATKPRRRNC